MPFRIFVGWLCFFVAFSGCKENGDGPSSINTIDTVEELSNFVNGLNYVINLPENQSFSFNPSTDFAALGVTNYATMSQGFSESDNPLTFTIDQTARAELLLERDPPSLIKFDYAICTSVKEISLAFPEVNINPVYIDYLVFVATTVPGYTSEDLIFGAPGNLDKYLQYIIDPMEIYPVGGVFIDEGNFHFMYGTFSLSRNGINIDGSYEEGSTGSSGDFNLEFFCSPN